MSKKQTIYNRVIPKIMLSNSQELTPTRRPWREFFDHFEKYVCCLLLAVFVTLLFAQIVSRELFSYSIFWIEELSVFLFVWFVFFGASHATRLSAHNRVTFQFGFFPPIVKNISLATADMAWIAFNLYFVYLSADFIFNKMNAFWKAQTLGIPMKYVYLVLPATFLLMAIRVIQVNYLKYVKGVSIGDPDDEEIEAAQNAMKREMNLSITPKTNSNSDGSV